MADLDRLIGDYQKASAKRQKLESEAPDDHGHRPAEVDAYDAAQTAMSTEVVRLEGAYRKAKETGRNRVAARDALSKARVRVRQAEEADPFHPRGQELASVKEG